MIRDLGRAATFSVALGLLGSPGFAQDAAAPDASTTIPASPATPAPAQGATPAPAPATPAASAPAAAPPVKAVQFADWFYRCVTVDAGEGKSAEQCEVAQIAQVKDQGKDIQILTMAFARTALPVDPKTKKSPGEGLLLTALVPLNMFLPSGLVFMDGERDVKRLDYRNCNQAGCWAQTLVDEKFVKGLTGAKSPIARMQLMTGQKINLKFSVNGLDKALAALGVVPTAAKAAVKAPAAVPAKKK